MNKQSTKTVIAIAGVVIVAGAFWILLIGPKRSKADELGEQVAAARTQTQAAERQAQVGLAAKRDFPHNYQQLVLLGKAVPADAGTSSLLVQLNHVSRHTRTDFLGIELKGAEAEGSESEGAVAALPPLGSSVGPAGLRSLPYQLDFSGGFFDTADFIEGINKQVRTRRGRVQADGRLVTFDRFEMSATKTTLHPKELEVKFFAVAYATPDGQGLTVGATAAGPAAAE